MGSSELKYFDFCLKLFLLKTGYFFSYCGFNNALSFKNITDTHIDAVEKFIRTDIPNVVKTENSEDLYGPFFANAPQCFTFLPGDRELIKEISSHVRHIVDKNGKNSGLIHFKSIESKSAEVKFSGSESQLENHSGRSYLLKKLISTADRNSNYKKGGYRYDSEIKKIAMLLRMISGPLGFKILQSNLVGSLPSLPSVNSYIYASNYHITEGVLRAEELRVYLNERRLPQVVCLSEDATRVTGRAQYDSRTNQIIGLTLPTSSETGMPIPLQFPARSADQMIDHFANGSISGFLNIVVAQPVVKGAAPFCLLAFGSDSKYTAMDVKNRWVYIENELKKVGIEVLTWSSDSDPRYNAAMRYLSKLGTKSKISWFSSSEISSGPIYLQDIIHIITKLRNLLLRTKWAKKQLFFGKFKIDMAHLYILLYKYSKDKHQLTESVLNPADRQNFLSAQRMCDDKVIELLNIGVENSDATALFLKMMQSFMSAFMDSNLSALERVRHAWYPLFVFRIWRQYIKSHSLCTLKDNFMSMNSYCCIELNAHGLIQLMVYLKETNRSHLFLPELFSSQPCESTFRQFRSFSSTFSTVINCTVKEAASRISKIQLQNEIMNGLSNNFVFPGLMKSPENENHGQVDLPSKLEIIAEIEKCQQDAVQTAKQFGLITRKPAKNYACKLELNTLQIRRSNVKINKLERISQLQRDKYAQIDLNNIKLQDYSGKLNSEDIGPTSPYVEILDDDGKQTITRKTSLCWLLRDDCQKLSSDRLIRVRAEKSKSCRAKCSLTDTKLKKNTIKNKQNKRVLLHSHD